MKILLYFIVTVLTILALHWLSSKQLEFEMCLVFLGWFFTVLGIFKIKKVKGNKKC